MALNSVKTLGLAVIIALSAASAPAVAGNNKLSTALGHYGRAQLITATGKATKQIQPDQVTIQVKLSGFGEDVGSVVTALKTQKKELLGSAQGANDNMARASVISLDVRENRRNRRNKGNSKEAYQGNMQLSLTMKIGDDPLALIAKVTDGRVEGISRTRFEVSDPSVNTDELKKQALADARDQAMEKAKLLQIKLGRLVNVTYRETPRRSNYGNGAAALTIRAMASFQRGDAKDN